MILIYGRPCERPLAAVAAACRRLRFEHVVLDERELAGAEVRLHARGGEAGGTLDHDGWSLDLAAVRGVYLRPFGAAASAVGAGADELAAAWRAEHALRTWTETTGARVCNRLSAMGSNGSKPYQALLIRRFFSVPATLVTNDPDEVRRFRARHGRVVYKSCSGVRSIVTELGDADDERLDRIRWCPTQFQARVEGRDVRVHVVGDRVLATAADADAVDYRYASRQGSEAELSAVELPADVADRCVALAASLGLPFAGIDLKFTPDGDVVCFEVNPSPGFTYFEEETGQPIAESVARYLAGV